MTALHCSALQCIISGAISDRHPDNAEQPMTVIATLITSYGTVHATDSLISRDLPDGKREYLEYQRPKIVKVRAFRGAMSYWGLAELENMWMLDWLKREAGQANKYSTAEDFALNVANHLNKALSRIQFRRSQDGGIGIHFTAYERVGDYFPDKD
jgi:hypothetical protein